MFYGIPFVGIINIIGIYRIKFRLDEMGDITWYNDVVNPIDSTDEKRFDSANALLNCETFEILDLMSDLPTLLFGAFDGHNIEFKVC